MYKKTAIVLGGTIPHIALIENLKLRGYHTVLIDYYENPPAKSVADDHIRESTLDPEKVLEIASKLTAALVISTAVDQANATACYVAEKLMLPAPYSYETALEVTNKRLMKVKMQSLGIPTSKFVAVRSTDTSRLTDLCYPVVVKPADTTGSKGVMKAENEVQLRKYLENALRISRQHEAIVEEFKPGIEIQADFFVQDGAAVLIMIREKIKVNVSGEAVLQSIGSIVPVDISKTALCRLQQISDSLVSGFRLHNTSLFIQAIVNGDDVSVIEFACRLGGGLSYSMIKIIAGFDILDATVNSFLKIPAKITYNRSAGVYATCLIYTQSGIFGYIDGYDELIRNKTISEFYCFKTPGMEIGSDLSSRNRVGAFLIKAENKDKLIGKMKTAISTIEVRSANGERMKIQKEIYSF